MTQDTGRSMSEKVLIRYQALFVALLLFFCGPYLLPDHLEGFMVPLLFTLVALAALTTAAVRRGTLIAGLLLAVPALLAGWFEPTEPGLAIVGGILQLLFLILVAAVILGHVIRSTRVTSDLLFGVASVYLLLALIWSVGYGIAHTADPGAISLAIGDTGLSADLHSTSGEKLRAYFSFVTLTTLGYGDIRPVSDAARILAMLEATIGQLFLVIVVARIVGLHTVQAAGRGSVRDNAR